MSEDFVKAATEAAEIMASNPREGYKYHAQCAVCTAISKETNKNIRPEVDAAVMNSQKAKSGLEVLAKHGIHTINLAQVQRHIRNHSPFVRQGIDAKQMQKRVGMAVVEHVNAQDGIQEIIDQGMDMIRNGDMPITERVFLTALKEGNKSHQVSKVAEIAKELEHKLFDKRLKAEVVEKLDVVEGELADE